MSRARDRLVIELHIAGFRVEPRSFAKGIVTFYLSTAETVTGDVTRIIDMAARQMAAERAVVA